MTRDCVSVVQTWVFIWVLISFLQLVRVIYCLTSDWNHMIINAHVEIMCLFICIWDYAHTIMFGCVLCTCWYGHYTYSSFSILFEPGRLSQSFKPYIQLLCSLLYFSCLFCASFFIYHLYAHLTICILIIFLDFWIILCICEALWYAPCFWNINKPVMALDMSCFGVITGVLSSTDL